MKQPRLHAFQHVYFEDPGYIEAWARENNLKFTSTRWYWDETAPDHDSYDWLIIMGGPMNIYEEEQYPWLKIEKEHIKKAIASGKKILGICLGAQLLCDVLGGKVFQNPCKEMGWYPVELFPETEKFKVLSGLSQNLMAFHFHVDAFDLPKDCVQIARSAACANQGFVYDHGRVVGFQFHLETSLPRIEQMIVHCDHELVPEKFVQSSQEILIQAGYVNQINSSMAKILKNWLD